MDTPLRPCQICQQPWRGRLDHSSSIAISDGVQFRQGVNHFDRRLVQQRPKILHQRLQERFIVRRLSQKALQVGNGVRTGRHSAIVGVRFCFDP